MKPYYQEDGCTIYHGDCREVLREFPIVCPTIDLILTDPPYGVGIEYGTFEDTEENVKQLMAEVMPVAMKRCKRMNLTCGTRQIAFYPPSTWIMCWLNRAGAFRNPWGFTCWQPILCYGPDPYLENRMGSRSDVIEHSETAENWGHPTPKPLNFWKKLLQRCSVKESDVVLDIFMGSGTTLRAAKDLGRKAIGIEIEEKYCEIAAKLLAQKTLFNERATPRINIDNSTTSLFQQHNTQR